MSTLMEELTAIKAVEDKLTANKVANFAYTDHAYNNPLTEADGVASYDPDAEQNIPNANASTLQVNSTILTKGWRAQASSITRMLMNHFLGRCSYNLNKINDLFSTLLTKLMAYMGAPNGLATLDEDGYVPSAQLNVTRESLDIDNVVNTGDSATPVQNGTDKFTTGGMFNFIASLTKEFDSSETYYPFRDIVRYDGKFYACKTVHQGSWNANDFEEFKPLDRVGDMLPNLLSSFFLTEEYEAFYASSLIHLYTCRSAYGSSLYAPSGVHVEGVVIDRNGYQYINVTGGSTPQSGLITSLNTGETALFIHTNMSYKIPYIALPYHFLQ